MEYKRFAYAAEALFCLGVAGAGLYLTHSKEEQPAHNRGVSSKALQEAILAPGERMRETLDGRTIPFTGIELSNNPNPRSSFDGSIEERVMKGAE